MSAVPRDPRVALVSERSDFFGGGQRSLLDLAVALRGGAFEPLAVLPGPGPLATALQQGGVAWVSLPLPPLRGARFIQAARALRGLVRLVRGRSIALLHSDSPRAALYAGLASRIARCRHVWHVRASRPSSALADRALLLLSDAALAVSRAAARRSAALRASRKVRVVHTGLPPIPFLERAAARLSLDLPPDRFVAGVVGRVERDKGCDDALAALPALRRAAPGALLAFLGPEDPAAPPSLNGRLRAASMGLSGAVLFLGDRPEAARLLRAFDVILHPSHHEALPRVLIEALLAGVPVVAAAVGGVPEVIESGVSGLLVPPHDPAALGAAAARVARDADLRLRLAGAGFKQAVTLFALEAMVRRVTAVYGDLLGGPGEAVRAPRETAR